MGGGIGTSTLRFPWLWGLFRYDMVRYFLGRFNLVTLRCLTCLLWKPTVKRETSGEIAKKKRLSFSPSKIEWDLTNGPRSVNCDSSLLDTEVLGSVKRGSCRRFLGFRWQNIMGAFRLFSYHLCCRVFGTTEPLHARKLTWESESGKWTIQKEKRPLWKSSFLGCIWWILEGCRGSLMETQLQSVRFWLRSALRTSSSSETQRWDKAVTMAKKRSGQIFLTMTLVDFCGKKVAHLFDGCVHDLLGFLLVGGYFLMVGCELVKSTEAGSCVVIAGRARLGRWHQRTGESNGVARG